MDIDSDADYDSDTDDDSVGGGHAADDDSGSDAEVSASRERKRIPSGPSDREKEPQHPTVRLGPSARTYAKALKSLVTTLCTNVLGLEEESLEAVRGLVFVEEMLSRPALRLVFQPSGPLVDAPKGHMGMSEEWTGLLRLVDRIRLRFRRKDVVVHQNPVRCPVDPAAPTAERASSVAARGGAAAAAAAAAAQSPQSRHASLLSMPIRSQRLSLPALEKNTLPTLPPLTSTTPAVLGRDKNSGQAVL